MKKTLLLLVFMLILLLFGCMNNTAAQGGVVVRGSSPTEPTKIIVPDSDDIVYVSQSGAKYHTADCPFVDDSFIPVTLEQALQEGKQPCSRCH